MARSKAPKVLWGQQGPLVLLALRVLMAFLVSTDHLALRGQEAVRQGSLALRVLLVSREPRVSQASPERGLQE